MPSYVFVLLGIVVVLGIAHTARTRRRHQHLAETPLTVALRKPVPEDPKHRAEGTTLVQQAAAISPAVGLALTVAASNAVAGPATTPEPTMATITVVPSTTTSKPSDVPSDVVLIKRALLERMRAKKARVSRTLRRTHVRSPPPAPPVHRVPAPRPPVTTPAAKPPPARRISRVAGTTRDRIISFAQSQLGVPYVYGAMSPGRAFDCSGFTEWVFSKVGISLPRTANGQYRATRPIATPAPGDLVFYVYGGVASHVGIYYKPGYMIVAPHSGTDVQVEAIYGSPVYATAL